MPTQTDDLNEKVKRLEEHFAKATGCKVMSEWKVDLRSCRFYFENKDGQEWQYICDIYQGDIEELSVDVLIALLEKAKWRQVLQESAGKQVNGFKDGKFSIAREWPKLV
jgi:hypothetical protein